MCSNVVTEVEATSAILTFRYRSFHKDAAVMTLSEYGGCVFCWCVCVPVGGATSDRLTVAPVQCLGSLDARSFPTRTGKLVQFA